MLPPRCPASSPPEPPFFGRPVAPAQERTIFLLYGTRPGDRNAAAAAFAAAAAAEEEVEQGGGQGAEREEPTAGGGRAARSAAASWDRDAPRRAAVL